jgi:hypothetical protein
MPQLRRTALRAILLFVLVVSPLTAATRTWTGAASDRWSNPANWNGGVPVAGDDLVFPFSLIGQAVSTNDLASGTMFHSITVNALGYRIGGNGIVLGAGGLILNAAFLVSLIHGELRFSSITLADSQTWRGQGAEYTLLGPTNINGKTLTITDAIRLDFDSISGTGAIIENSPNGLIRSESSEYAGTVTVNAGPCMISGGTSGDVQVIGRGVGGDQQVNGTNASLELSAASVGNVTVNGSSALTLHGYAGTSYAGNLTFLPATGDPAWLVVPDGSIPVACNVTGRVALGNALLVVRSGPYAPLTLIHSQGGPISGTFLGLPEGAILGNGAWVRISYAGGSGNDVTLTPVSTPVTGTTTVITSAANPSSPAQFVTFTAMVTSASGTPAGEVSFYDGGRLLGSSALDPSGHATMTASFAAGSHLVTAAYPGADGLASSQANVRQAACDPPMLTEQPASQSIVSGQPVTLTVQANATPPFTFQWYRGSSGDVSAPILGATSPALTLPALTRSASFWVQLSNGCGAVPSATATITVLARRRTVTR